MPRSLRSNVGVKIDIWRVALDKAAPCEYSLSDDEREKTRRFRREIDAKRFVAARSALRQILANYLRCEPHEIRFSYNENGKPFVENCDWHFNLSHCEDLALIAVCEKFSVGIDLEKVDENRARRMKKMLSADDVNADLTSREICERWVKTEALIKARGEGLSVPLPELRVLECGYKVELLELRKDFVGVLAIQGEAIIAIHWRNYEELVSL